MLQEARNIILKQVKTSLLPPLFSIGTSHFRHLVHSNMHGIPISIQTMAATQIEMQIRKQLRSENISAENKSLTMAQLTSFLLTLPQPRTLTLLHHYIHTGNLQEEFGNQKKGITSMMLQFYQ